MLQIALIERYPPSGIFWENLIKSKRISELTVEELLNKYKGFEGELILHSKINEKESEIDLLKTINEFKELGRLNNYFMVYICNPYFVKTTNYLQQQITQVGFEVGVFDYEKTIYSSIFNEILFGNLEELVQKKDLLNENFLFPNKHLAENYVKLHNQLAAQGKGVEDYEKMEIYQIFIQK